MNRLYVGISCVLLFIVACTPPATLAPTVTPTVAQTATTTATSTPSPTITNTPTVIPTSTRTPLPTLSPLVEQLKPGQVVMHPATENNPYVFYTYFPRSAVREKNIIVAVWPHGGGMYSDDYEYHKTQAQDPFSWLKAYSEKHKIPLVVAAIPRIGSTLDSINAHIIHPGTFSTSNQMISRPDLKMIDIVWTQYIPSIQAAGLVANEKVLMMGQSSSGMFTHRFAILHPELVQAAWMCAEAPAPLPASELDGTPLNYALGVKNLESLTGKPFDLEAYLEIPQMICVGELDTKADNDPTNPDIFPGWQSQYLRNTFGQTNPERIEFFYKYLVSIGAPVEFRLYKGIGHTITDEMIKDAFDFLVAHSQP